MLLHVSPLSAATGDTVDGDSGSVLTDTGSGIGNIEIWQESPSVGVYSDWTLFKTNNETVSGRHMHQIFDSLPVGNYTIIIDPLEGATAHVTVTVDDKVIQDNDFPRANFSLGHDQNVKISINNIFTRVGTVSVQSSPAGLMFTLEGPNHFKTTGSTPSDFQNLPEGLYTAKFEAIEGCIEAQSRSARLQKESRISLSINLSCDNIEYLEQSIEGQKTLMYVSVTINGETINFTDVPLSDWFAPFVNTSIRTGIMSGYKDSRGRLTGEYGPSNTVSIAELAKIAHELAGIDETTVHTRPLNSRARNTWFSQYFASAEKRGWLVFKDNRLDPARDATRAEVVATILQAHDVPRNWPKGEMFTDVTPDSPYAASIETAVAHGLAAGYTDSLGNPMNEFRPNASINRAEISKLISRAIELYIEKTAEFRSYTEE